MSVSNAWIDAVEFGGLNQGVGDGDLPPICEYWASRQNDGAGNADLGVFDLGGGRRLLPAKRRRFPFSINGKTDPGDLVPS